MGISFNESMMELTNDKSETWLDYLLLDKNKQKKIDEIITSNVSREQALISVLADMDLPPKVGLYIGEEPETVKGIIPGLHFHSEWLWNELDKFFCGNDYDEQKKKLNEGLTATKAAVITYIAGIILKPIGISVAAGAAVIAVALEIIFKMGINIWCEYRKEHKNESRRLVQDAIIFVG